MNRYLCNNGCLGDSVLTESDVIDIPLGEILKRHEPGDIFTDKECSHCGAVALPEVPEVPRVPEVSIDYKKLSAWIGLLDFVKNDTPAVRRPKDQERMAEMIDLLTEIRTKRPFAAELPASLDAH